MFLNFINRILFPVVKLNSIDATDDFYNTTKEWTEMTSFYAKNYRPIGDLFSNMTKVTRVIMFISDADKHANDISNLTKTARELGIRTDLRIGIVTDKTLANKYLNSKGNLWFNSTTLSNVIVAFDNKRSGSSLQRFYNLDSSKFDMK